MKLESYVIFSLEIYLLHELGIIGQGNCVELAKGIHQQVGTTSVRITERLQRDKRSDDKNTHHAELPVEFDLDLKVSGSNVTLHLHRNDNIPPAVPIFLKKNGNIFKLNLPAKKKTALYLDKSHGASVEYECFPGMGSTQPGSCRHLVRGNFQLDNRTYLLEPDVSSGLTLHNHDDTDDVIHVIYEIQEEHDFKTDYIVTEHVKSESHVLHATSTKGYTPQKTRRRKRSIINYKVEFLPVLDYPIYKFWYDRSNATTAAARDVDAIENIREFYAFVLNSIDLRYQSIVSTTIAIQVVFAGIFIADTPSASTWTENYKVSATPRDEVDASVALTAFKQWLALQTSLPAYDHAMAFTGYDLVRNGSSSIAGLAWTPGACNHAIPYANSISQDHFDAGLATTAAHELGHNLGSKHDGEDNVCSADDKYVMSPSTGGVTDARAINHFKFSTCSVTQIESYIATLDRDNNNCLLTSSFNSSALDLYDGLEAGLLYSADVQCEANVGPGSYFCRSLYTDISEMCARMMCSVPGNNTCITNTAWEGTVCGNQKLCRRGVCTCDTKASSVPDNCPQGDRPGAYVNNMTCKAATTANPMYCYQAAFLINCCESCRQYYIGVMGCEYGDHSTGCRLSSCPNYDAATLASGCCGTCGNTSATSGNSVSPSTPRLPILEACPITECMCVKCRLRFACAARKG
ncbi:hypothetical protein DPMN_182840 [Dreissena polymorpha]|uniref:Peptidase M12B domain-containing protein n=1 Tax=Dreissena polymorpha TaxID=45954 RepID=A0A9D4DH31_DREPO|nr:hypothetical protein DPMN_182840 [Dreissena polymorpha]